MVRNLLGGSEKSVGLQERCNINITKATFFVRFSEGWEKSRKSLLLSIYTPPKRKWKSNICQAKQRKVLPFTTFLFRRYFLHKIMLDSLIHLMENLISCLLQNKEHVRAHGHWTSSSLFSSKTIVPLLKVVFDSSIFTKIISFIGQVHH